MTQTKGLQELVERIATPVIDTDQIVLATEGKEVKTHMLHRKTEVQ